MVATSRVYSISARETSMCNERESSGLICQGCGLLARCVRIHGGWETIPVETCSPEEGFYCNLNVGGCSNRTGPCHPLGFEGNFACTSEGVFPDPYDCQRYHLCYRAIHTLVSANIECGGNRAFSAATGDCSLTLDDDVCTTKQYTCQHSGDSQAWPGNRNIFYICKANFEQGQRILYPAIYRCASGEIFNGQDCVQKEEMIYHSPTIGLTTSTAVNDSIYNCEKRGLFGDPADCHSYYYCDSTLTWAKYTCPTKTHFNNRTKSCVRGEC